VLLKENKKRMEQGRVVFGAVDHRVGRPAGLEERRWKCRGCPRTEEMSRKQEQVHPGVRMIQRTLLGELGGKRVFRRIGRSNREQGAGKEMSRKAGRPTDSDSVTLTTQLGQREGRRK